MYSIEFQIQVYCMQHYTVNKKKIETQTDLLKGDAKMQILQKSYSIIAGIIDQLSRVVIKSWGPGIFPGYFYWKIEEKQDQKKSLAV